MQQFEGQVLGKLRGSPLAGVAVVVTNRISGDIAASLLSDINGRYVVEISDGDYDFAVGSLVIENVPMRGGGTVVLATTGEAIAYGKVCYMTASGTVKLALNNGTLLESTARLMCITTGGLANGASGIFKMSGEVVGLSGGTAGAGGWLSTAGAITGTAPTMSDTVSLVAVGQWLSASAFLFNASAPQRSLIANMSLVSIVGDVSCMAPDGILLYVVGSFNSVVDASGTITRNRAACLNTSTGLWTSWNPNANGTVSAVEVFGGQVYLGGGFTQLGGAAHSILGRVNTTTGARDATFMPITAGSVACMTKSGSRIFFGGAFTTYNGVTTNGTGACDGAGPVAWRVNDAGVRFFFAGTPFRMAWNGVSVSMIANVSNFLILNGSGQYWGRNFINADSSNGQALQSTNGWTAAGGGTVCALCNGQVIVGNNETTGYVNLPASTAAGLTRNRACGLSSSGAINSFDPNLPAVTSPMTAACGAAAGGIIIAGSFLSVGGDANQKLISRVSASGVVDTGFSTVWGVTSGWPVCLVAVSGGIFAGGNFNTTINGVTKRGLAAFNALTGALY